MGKNILAIGAIMMMAACTQTSKNPFLEQWDTPYGVPPFDKIQLSYYIPAIKAGIEEQNKELDAIINSSEAPTFENTVAAYELGADAGQGLCRAFQFG
jgi:peptidyl-dipeptidase Dcp